MLPRSILAYLFLRYTWPESFLVRMPNSDKDFGEQIIDDVKGHQVEDAAPVPESLRHMSPEEIRTLEKKMVRKMDIVIM